MDEEEEEVGRNKGKQKEIFLDSSSSVTFSSVKHPISAEKLRNCGGFPFNGSQFTNFPRANFT